MLPCFSAWLVPLTSGDCSQGKRLLQEQGWKGPALDMGVVKETQRWQLPASSPVALQCALANPDRKPCEANRLPFTLFLKIFTLLQHLPDHLILHWMGMDELSSRHNHSVNVFMKADEQYTARDIDGYPLGFPLNKTAFSDSANFPQHWFPVSCNRWRMSVLCVVPDSKSLMDQIALTSLWSDKIQDVYFLSQHIVSNILPPLILNFSGAKNLEFHPTHVGAGLAFPCTTPIRSSLTGGKKIASIQD